VDDARKFCPIPRTAFDLERICAEIAKLDVPRYRMDPWLDLRPQGLRIRERKIVEAPGVEPAKSERYN
jgi:hypothetical protein